MEREPNGAEALDELFWRSEILQALYWMRGEGLAQEVDAESLARFLAAAPDLVTRHLARLAEEGYLEPAGAGYWLTARGVEEGGRSFHDEFAELTRPGHGDCAPGCWCHSPEHAGEPCPGHSEHASEGACHHGAAVLGETAC